MALGSTIGIAQALSEYRSMNSKGIGEAFNAELNYWASNSNILSDLVGSPGSKKPFTTTRDLTKGANDRVNMAVAATLGMHPRMGSEQLVGYNEIPRHGNWLIRVDQKRIAVGWSEFVRSMTTTGASFKEVYAELVGIRMGQIEQEDALMRLRKDATPGITLRPNNKASMAALRVSDNFDVDLLKRGAAKLSSLSATPAMIGKTRSGRPIHKFIAFGAESFMRGIKDETAYATPANAALGAEGEDGAFFNGDYLPVDGHLLKPWYVVDHDNPGPIGSSVLPKALLGDVYYSGGFLGSLTTGPGTAAFAVFGGGVTNAALGDQADLYKPFVHFPGYPYKHYQEESPAADSAIYGFVIYDPDDGKWCYFDYTGSDNDGQKITIRRKLHSSTAGIGYTTIKADGLGGSGSTIYTYDTAVNKVSGFGPGCIIIPVNNYLVPYGWGYLWGADAGGYAYGAFKNQRIADGGDFGDRVAFGVKSIYGTGVRLDTAGKPRGYVKFECAVQHGGIDLPVL